MLFKSIAMKFVAGMAILMVLASCAPIPPASPYAQSNAAPNVDQQITLDAIRTQAVADAMTNLTQSAVLASTDQPTATPTAASTLAATSAPAATATPAPTNPPAPQVALATAAPTAAAFTPYPTPTLAPYSCGVISVSPSLRDRIKAGTNFTGSWRIENSGSEYWQGSEVDVHYIMGEKFQTKADPYDLGMTVGPTGMYTVNIDMKAPKLAGPYYAQWAIKYGQVTICTLNLTVYVVK